MLVDAYHRSRVAHKLAAKLRYMHQTIFLDAYIHKTADGQRVSFQTWTWEGDSYKLTQYIIDDQSSLHVSKFECEYRATRREELTNLLLKYGYSDVKRLFPEETGFYQPIAVARKKEQGQENKKGEK